MSNQTRAVIGAVVFLVIGGGIGYWALTRRPLDENDYGTLTGTLKSAKEEYAGKNNLFLEFYLVESPIRFRVGSDGYEESFDSNAFFANMKPGMQLTLSAKKSELVNPNKPPLDPVPTVFVHALKDDQMAYSTLAGRKKWEEKNKFYGCIVAGFFALVGFGMGLRSLKMD